MTEKRKFNPLFPTLIMSGERPTYFEMAKNVKSLIIFSRDCGYEVEALKNATETI
jgi:hypothetical protein